LIIDGWVRSNPLVRVIVTSRVKLNVGSEKLLEITAFQPHPLDAAPAEMLKNPGPGLELFERQRKEWQQGFRLAKDNVFLVNQICYAVGGLPLGIELAAAAERTLTEIEGGISQRSDFLRSTRQDIPERHRWLLHEAPVALNVGGYAALRISTR